MSVLQAYCILAGSLVSEGGKSSFLKYNSLVFIFGTICKGKWQLYTAPIIVHVSVIKHS